MPGAPSANSEITTPRARIASVSALFDAGADDGNGGGIRAFVGGFQRTAVRGSVDAQRETARDRESRMSKSLRECSGAVHALTGGVATADDRQCGPVKQFKAADHLQQWWWIMRRDKRARILGIGEGDKGVFVACGEPRLGEVDRVRDRRLRRRRKRLRQRRRHDAREQCTRGARTDVGCQRQSQSGGALGGFHASETKAPAVPAHLKAVQSGQNQVNGLYQRGCAVVSASLGAIGAPLAMGAASASAASGSVKRSPTSTGFVTRITRA